MAWLKAKIILALIAVVWASMIIISSPLQVPLTILGRLKSEKLKAASYSFWIWQDQGVNVIVSIFAMRPANPDVTVSSKVGYMAENGSKTAAAMAFIIDWLFWIAIRQKNHCYASIERDEKHHDWRM